ncbi:hypothetical protein ACI48D_09430 [Massilia sp. LXY-6]|uniref:hypothetical protein n=1 Tax=Massilia sp. LXY-6 TaxID=3379823 RepID=UPI003EE15E50
MNSRTTGGLAATLALALVLGAAPARAGTARHGTASIGNIGYRLIDLTPNDGIAPSIEFSSITGSRYTLVNLYPAPAYQSAPDYRMNFGEQATTLEGPGGSAGGSVQGGIFSATIDIGANSADATSSDSGIFFSLSPHTTVIFSADTSGELAFDPGQADMTANARLRVEIYPDDGTVLTYTSGVHIELPGRETLPASLSFSAGDSELSGRLDHTAYVLATVAPVPEPAPAAMLLAGLALLPAARRRPQPG